MEPKVEPSPARGAGLQRFVREYTAGLRTSDVRRLFGKDRQRVYAVLAREHAAVPEPKTRFKRWLWRARLLFLGISYKLSPPRRMLFALAVVTGIAGFGTVEATFEQNNHTVTVGFSPMLHMISIASLLFLLMLELVDRVAVRDEIDLARQLQRDLLPRAAPTVPGYAFAHSYRTANDIGGDYYDFLPVPGGRLALVSGDASGHGMAAGLLMAIARATIGTAIDIDPGPSALVAVLNRALHRSVGRRSFMTLFYGLLEPGAGRLEFVVAAHPFPLLRRADGRVEELGEGGLPLGLKPDATFAPATATLAPGDMLVLYTDGLVESIGAKGEAFGFERLRWLVGTGGDAAALHDRIMASFDDHLGAEPLADDVSLVVVARLP